MSVLVDTSVWVQYFRKGKGLEKLDFLIDENLVVTNDLILAELIPFLMIGNQKRIIFLLNTIKKLELTIDWHELIDFQFYCLNKGLNVIGIPDLIIAQNAKQNNCEIYSLDNHFPFLEKMLDIQLIA